MSTPPKFRMYLKASATLYYFVDPSGLVQTTTSAIPLSADPANWEDIEIKWGRNTTFYGIFRGVTSAMTFIGDAAAICQYIYYTQGVEGQCLFVLQERNGVSWDYSDLYAGNLDFATSTDEFDRFTVNVSEGGLQSIIEAKANTPYDIPVASGVTTVNIDGPELRANHSWVPLGITYQNVVAQAFVLPSAFVGQDGEYNIGVAQGAQTMDWPTSGTLSDQLFANFLFRSTASQSTVIYGSLSLLFTNNSGNVNPQSFECRLYRVNSSKVVQQVWSLYLSPNVAVGASLPILFAFSQAAALDIGDRLYMVFDSSGAVCTFAITPNPTSSFPYNVELASTFQMPASQTKGYRYYEVLNKWVAQATNGAYTASSGFLSNPATTSVDNKPYQVVVSPADAVRRIANPKLTITLSDLFQDASGRWLLGLGVNAANQLIMEHLSTFFDNASEIADLGEVTIKRIVPASEYMFTQFKTGFETQSYDNLNGRDEYNTLSVYKLPLNAPEASERNFVSPWRADTFGIESVRNEAPKKTTDTRSDKDVFLFEIDATPFSGAYNLRRLNNSTNTSGVSSPNKVYNISMSPARSMRRLGPLLHSVAYLRDSESVLFQTAEKNQGLVSNLGSGSITENAHLAVAGLGNILFKPSVIILEAQAPINLSALMASGPYGYFTGKDSGRVIKGFVLDVSIRPGKNSIKEWALLATPSCDLTQFYPH